MGLFDGGVCEQRQIQAYHLNQACMERSMAVEVGGSGGRWRYNCRGRGVGCQHALRCAKIRQQLCRSSKGCKKHVWERSKRTDGMSSSASRGRWGESGEFGESCASASSFSPTGTRIISASRLSSSSSTSSSSSSSLSASAAPGYNREKNIKTARIILRRRGT